MVGRGVRVEEWDAVLITIYCLFVKIKLAKSLIVFTIMDKTVPCYCKMFMLRDVFSFYMEFFSNYIYFSVILKLSLYEFGINVSLMFHSLVDVISIN